MSTRRQRTGRPPSSNTQRGGDRPQPGSRRRGRAGSICVGALLGGIATAAVLQRSGDPHPPGGCPGAPESGAAKAPVTVDQLVAMTDAELGRIDPLIVNLTVARGIPEYENLVVDRYVATLDDWAATIRLDTERHWYRFRNDPAQFNNSEAEYRICWLASDINAVFEIDYDLNDFDAADPANLFLNGLIDRKLGTCVSMPMLYVALGWRLGYPIKLVSVPTHLFARWDDGDARINIEATGYGGELPDEFYAEEYFVSPDCVARQAELAALSPREMLAMLLLARADYWSRRGDFGRAVEDSLRANVLFPSSPLAITELEQTWGRRARNDGYFTHAREHLADAGQALAARRVASEDLPTRKLVFTNDGPVEVSVDPANSLAERRRK